MVMLYVPEGIGGAGGVTTGGAGGAIAVADTRTGASVATVTSSSFVPSVPSFQKPTLAEPSAAVMAVAAPRLPLPAVTANCTITPSIGWPRLSLTTTVGATGT